MKPLVCGILAALVACGPAATEPPVEGNECESQTDCDENYRKTCVAGVCSEEIPRPEQPSTLNIGFYSVRLKNPKSFRALVLHSVKSDGSIAQCDGLETLDKLLDPRRYNLASYPIELTIQPGGDGASSLAYVDGPGRLVYVEVYGSLIVDGQPGAEGPAIGVGCVENVPYDADNPPTVGVDILPVK